MLRCLFLYRLCGLRKRIAPVKPSLMHVQTESAGEILRAAAEAERAGENSRAAELLQLASGARDVDSDALISIADAQMRLKRPRRALEALDRAAQAEPNNATVFFRRGQFFGQAGQHAVAVQNFERAVKLEPRRFEILIFSVF